MATCGNSSCLITAQLKANIFLKNSISPISGLRMKGCTSARAWHLCSLTAPTTSHLLHKWPQVKHLSHLLSVENKRLTSKVQSAPVSHAKCWVVRLTGLCGCNWVSVWTRDLWLDQVANPPPPTPNLTHTRTCQKPQELSAGLHHRFVITALHVKRLLSADPAA